MTIYEIDQSIAALLDGAVDEETGELLIDTAALDALQMERDETVENLACYVKNLAADITAIKAEEDALAKRRKAAEAKRDRLKTYLGDVLQGEKFSTPRVAVSFRKSESVELLPEFVNWAMENAPDLLRYKTPEPDKKAINQALADGRVLPASKVSKLSMTIK